VQVTDSRFSAWCCLALIALACLAGAGQGSAIEWVEVGDPGNPPDDRLVCQAGAQLFICRTDIGSVPYPFAISKHETTNNSVAASDPNDLFNALSTEILRSGSQGSYTYSVATGLEQRPVRWVNYYHALRFANWLHNGKPVGLQDETSTEDGAYTLLGANPVEVERNAGAVFWLVSEDEWHKAAYHDPDIDPESGWYWEFATGTDDPPIGELPAGGSNSANLCPFPKTEPGGPPSCEEGVSMGPGEPTDVGAYADSVSPWGTLDQTGNLWELLEDWVLDDRDPQNPQLKVILRGGVYNRGLLDAAASARSDMNPEAVGTFAIGFRVGAVEAIPEPSSVSLRIAAALSVTVCALRCKNRSR
jgi:formylglycine-generating enzyme required for sulfatase activity